MPFGRLPKGPLNTEAKRLKGFWPAARKKNRKETTTLNYLISISTCFTRFFLKDKKNRGGVNIA